jgi:hypothetical protein
MNKKEFSNRVNAAMDLQKEQDAKILAHGGILQDLDLYSELQKEVNAQPKSYKWDAQFTTAQEISEEVRLIILQEIGDVLTDVAISYGLDIIKRKIQEL